MLIKGVREVGIFLTFADQEGGVGSPPFFLADVIFAHTLTVNSNGEAIDQYLLTC